MSRSFRGYAVEAKGAPFKLIEFSPGELRDEQVEIAVEYCGICHSDLSVADNEWGNSVYPFVPGHEVVGKITAAGPKVKGLKVGQRVGLGWFSESCMACPQCLSGNHNLCVTPEQTMMGRHGGFADRVRCHWAWAIPTPDSLDPQKAGPLFCGGITVFNPLIQCDLPPTARVGVIGIGGLGHMALQFLNKWGCEVTAFTSTDGKRDEAMKFGAHRVVNSRDSAQLQKIAGSLDFILCTANATLPWDAILACLAPKGRLHIVGAVLEPIPVSAFALLSQQKAVSGTPLGSPFNCARMVEFAARHNIAPQIELFPMSRVNDAFERLRAGKARYRIVLQNDLH